MLDTASHGRRGVLAAAAALAVSTPSLSSGSVGSRSATPPPLAPRLKSSNLVPLRELGVLSREGPLQYPDWLRGTWRVRNEVARFSMPLGKAFVDDFTQDSAYEDITQGAVYEYSLRFISALPPDAPSAAAAPSTAARSSKIGGMMEGGQDSTGGMLGGGSEAIRVVQERAYNALEETRAFLGADGAYL